MAFIIAITWFLWLLPAVSFVYTCALTMFVETSGVVQINRFGLCDRLEDVRKLKNHNIFRICIFLNIYEEKVISTVIFLLRICSSLEH